MVGLLDGEVEEFFAGLKSSEGTAVFIIKNLNPTNEMTAPVEESIFLARVAEQAERFEDMVNFLSKVLDEKRGDVNSDERNLLSVAFKNLISSKRAACRTIAAIE